MDVDSKVLSFSEQKLFGLKELVGYDNPNQVIESGLNVEYSKLVCMLCNEISELYEMKDTPSAMKTEDDLKGFLLDLSVFLSDLDCPLESISCGPIECRFKSVENRRILINFLMSEMKSARLYAKINLEKPSTSSDSTDDVWASIKECLNILSVAKPRAAPSVRDILANLTSAADSRLQSYVERPVPLFNAVVDEKRAAALDQIVRTLRQDCRARNLLLVKRADVSINSFLWTERVRNQEDEIRKLFTEKRNVLSNVNCPDIIHVLAATQYILKIERASSARRRKNTKSMNHPLTNAAAPPDRGGRTTDMAPISNETFRQQQDSRNNPSGGRGGRGGYRGGRGGGRGDHHQGGQGGGGQQKFNSFENQVRQEFVERHDGSRGGNRGGRGGRGYRGGNRGRGGYY